ncbi:hypothetical protein FJ930_27645 [Mesorhizobium sp. B2-4-15]|uniref:hypothetical protein n=1 Tax=unclassified Mesorhizobium TaxID=325217 RepID=UPI00112B7C7C|nr:MULTISPECIES: hypothetical protein [unclassified Mesorhizobium]TPK61504.1 hypothetical protein FJ930_27645 [Mesorhizobium sp. B2-4-15]TPM25308.1 hypothetical protein FJ958_21610 [Mesorhizobium sp. B2-3-5]
MAYDLASLPLKVLIGPLACAEDLLARLDERVHKSPVRDGFLQRSHFADAAAALWLEGELASAEKRAAGRDDQSIRAAKQSLKRSSPTRRADNTRCDHCDGTRLASMAYPFFALRRHIGSARRAPSWHAIGYEKFMKAQNAIGYVSPATN